MLSLLARQKVKYLHTDRPTGVVNIVGYQLVGPVVLHRHRKVALRCRYVDESLSKSCVGVIGVLCRSSVDGEEFG